METAMTNYSYLNVQAPSELASRLGVGLLGELVALFKDYRPQVDSMREAIMQKDYYKCKFVAHKLKSASANLGGEKLSSDCDFFEELDPAMDTSEILKKFESFKSEYEHVVQELDLFLKQPSV